MFKPDLGQTPSKIYQKKNLKIVSSFSMRPFNNYVDKVRMSVFDHTQDIKTVYAGGGEGPKWQNSVYIVVE